MRTKSMVLGIIVCAMLNLVSCKGHTVASNKEKENSKKPNIIVLLADDMRLDYLSAMGMNSVIETPNLDQLAASGTLFKNAFVTTAICMPSRTTILTGMYERKHGVTFGANAAMTESAWSKTYPVLLRENGYYTGWVGKNHTPVGMNEKGFGYKSGVMEKSFDFWYAGHGHLTFYPKKRHKIFRNSKEDNQIDIIQEGIGAFMGSEEALLKSNSFLKARPQESPFCLMINFNVPHSSSTNSMMQLEKDPELFKSAYRDRAGEIERPTNYIAKADIKTPKLPKGVYSGDYIPSYDWVRTPETLLETQIRTLQTITGIDKVLGSILDELQAQNQLDNTLIVFTSDHGLQHGEYGLGGKTFLYDTNLRIPLIIKAPGKKNKTVRTLEELCLTTDIAPTLLDYAGIEVPKSMQGSSIRPLLEGKSIEWREDFFSENMFMEQNYPRMEAVRSADYKYIRYFSKDKDQHHALSLVASILGEKPIYEELFDLKKDPEESTNLAEDFAYKSVLEKFRDRNNKLIISAKGGNQLPETHIKDMQNTVFKDRVTALYETIN